MKYLKIEDNGGFFQKEAEKASAEWIPIDQITKDNLLPLLNKAISTDLDSNLAFLQAKKLVIVSIWTAYIHKFC